jgi:hypothetical protein
MPHGQREMSSRSSAWKREMLTFVFAEIDSSEILRRSRSRRSLGPEFTIRVRTGWGVQIRFPS